MNVLGTIQNAARRLHLNLPVLPGRRRRWRQWLAERSAVRDGGTRPGAVRLGWWPRSGTNECGLPAAFDDLPERPAFWLKWLPQAEASEFQLAFERMKGWRKLHPDLAPHVADMVDYSAQQRLVLLEYRAGIPLGSIWRHEPADAAQAARMERQAADVGAWLRAFAAGAPPYGPEVQPLLGEHAWLDSGGHPRVNARRQLECRIEQGRRAADRLARDGLGAAARWAERFDLDGLLSALGTQEAAGWVHGDMKPDNVLVNGNALSIIDWWTTPRAGWPVPDAALFAAHIAWSAAPPNRDRVLRVFLDTYYPEGRGVLQQQLLELIASIWMIRMAADRALRCGPWAPLSRRSARSLRLATGGPLFPR